MFTRSKIFIAILIAVLFASLNFAQHVPTKHRGDPRYRAKGQMEGNRIRASIFNHGQSGRYGGEFPINEQTPYEWPKNTGKVYLALTGIFVGGEVVDEVGQTQRIINVMNYRQSPQGQSWNFEPVPGFYGSTVQEIANSEKRETWPAFWPDRMGDQNDPGWAGKWNGYFGKDRFQADMEMFYRASDDRYSRYTNYYPDSTDRTRKGLGILLDVRVLTWTQVLVQDVMFHIHTIINDGTEDIDKVGVTIWFADFVGGDGDSQDDISEFDLLEDILWARDSDHRAPLFGNDPVGIVAVSFLETPGNSIDRIDNDGDSPERGPKVTAEMLEGEIPDNGIDDNGNGLIDENQTHIPFGVQEGVTYADGIAQPVDPSWIATRARPFRVEPGSPVVTSDMVQAASGNKWKLWPPPDDFQNGIVHLIMVEEDDIGLPFKDNIDNNGDGEEGSPTITQAIIDQAAEDAPYFRYRVNDKIILYNVIQSTLGMKYADGIDNNGDGIIDEGIDEGIDVLIDEDRDDGIDNDYDWNILTDDVGVDGIPNTGDYGEGDGKPTSGARFGLPGEPNVDVTDVSETDQIGITNAQKIAAGALNINSDATMWFDFMIPGKFFEPFPVIAGEYDLFVSSSFFPLRAGEREPFAIAVLLGNAPLPDPNGELRKQEILRKRVRAQETYNNDYQFAQAPLSPTVTAIAGDKRVTLYWDDIAESSFDTYIHGIGGDGNDFEGYRIYRSTDPAFQDIENITSGFGTPQFKTPLAIFDLDNGINGFDPVGIDGVHYYIGDDSGLSHSFVDSTVVNGFTYYYAVVSFDRGYPVGEIIPSESPFSITVKADGTIQKSSNVAVVKPEAPVAGFVPAGISEVELVEGTTTGKLGFEIIDMFKIKEGHKYSVTFEDTVKQASSPTVSDTLTTKNFTLTNVTEGTVLIDKSTNLAPDYEQPITEGFRITLFNEVRVAKNNELSGWSDETLPDFVFEKLTAGQVRGTEKPNDYRIEFDDNVGFGHSSEIRVGNNTFPAKDVNFKVYNISEAQYINFGFIEVDLTDGEGKLSVKEANRDRIVFVEKDAQDRDIFTWWFYFPSGVENFEGYRIPAGGDTATIVLRKPFLANDRFEFFAKAASVDKDQAKKDLDKIKVVPNPYVASARWEPKNPFTSGRGPRLIHFIHLPAKCTIRVFTVSGELVKTIEHDEPLNNGTAEWDLLSRDNLTISYGVYVFHVDAPGIGEKIGKFAIIK